MGVSKNQRPKYGQQIVLLLLNTHKKDAHLMETAKLETLKKGAWYEPTSSPALAPTWTRGALAKALAARSIFHSPKRSCACHVYIASIACSICVYVYV